MLFVRCGSGVGGPAKRFRHPYTCTCSGTVSSRFARTVIINFTELLACHTNRTLGPAWSVRPGLSSPALLFFLSFFVYLVPAFRAVMLSLSCAGVEWSGVADTPERFLINCALAVGAGTKRECHVLVLLLRAEKRGCFPFFAPPSDRTIK